MMKAIDLGTVLACLATMAACPSSDTSGDDAGSGSRGREETSDGPSRRDSGGNYSDAFVATCTPALGRLMGPSCETCLQNNCRAIIASCTFDDCVDCLLGCTMCESACTSSTADAGGDTSASQPPESDGRDASNNNADSSSAPSCEKITSGNCCSFASFAGLGNQCQQAAASRVESVCSTLLSNLQSYGVCR